MVNGSSRGRPWLIAVLLVSLGLNLFLGGLMAGRWVSGPSIRHAERGRDAPGRLITDRMAASLPAEHRAAFEAAIAKHRDALAHAATQAREARQQVRDALVKEPFDRTSLDAAFDTLRQRNETLQSTFQIAITEAAASLPAEARQRLADWRAHRRRR